MPGQAKTAILLVDGDKLSRGALRALLSDEGYGVSAVDTAPAALDSLAQANIRLVVLNAGAAPERLLTFCRWLRGGPLSPLILLLAFCPSTDALIEGFDAGADDVLAKPFDPREFLARIRSLLQRRRAIVLASRHNLRFGNVALDLANLMVRLPGGNAVRLTRQEARVLHCLLLNAGQLVSRDIILRSAWESSGARSRTTEVDVYVRRVRQKLDLDPLAPTIAAVYGVGYRLCPRGEVEGGHLRVLSAMATAD
jgi:DNA-binding response OmpR family regulator